MSIANPSRTTPRALPEFGKTRKVRRAVLRSGSCWRRLAKLKNEMGSEAMIAWNILVHAVMIVIRNFGVAVRISAVPFVILSVITTMNFASSFGSVTATSQEHTQSDFLSALMLLPTAFLTFWIVVGWHRFILLEERPRSIIPPFHGSRVFAYFLTGLVIYVAAAFVVLVLLVPLSMLGAGIGLRAGLNVVAIAVMVAVGLVFARLIVLLPAAAIGHRLGVSGAWEATIGSTGTFLLLGFLLMGAGMVMAVTALVIIVFPPALLVIQIIYQWITMIVGASILTTLYGHYVEKRELVV